MQPLTIAVHVCLLFQDLDEILVLNQTNQLELFKASELFGGDSLKINYLRFISFFRHGVENVSSRNDNSLGK